MADKFTIRGFTADMRTRDVYACWPFAAGDATPDQVRSWLPPLTVPNWRRADKLGQSSSHRPDTAGEQLNPPSNEENELSRVGDGQRVLENPPVEEAVVPQREREPEDSLSEMMEGNLPVEEEIENPLVEEAKGEKEDSVSEMEGENLENPMVEDMVPQPEDDSERELPENSAEEKLEMTCPVCNVFKAMTTVTAMNEHMASCLAQAILRREKWQMEKGLSSKKRSIAEIDLEAAPKTNGGKEATTEEAEGAEIERKKKEKNPPLNDNNIEEVAATKEQVENCDSAEKHQEEEALSPIFGILEISHEHIAAESISSVSNIQEANKTDAQVPRSESLVELYAKEQPSQSNEANGNDENRKEACPIIVESEVEHFANTSAHQSGASISTTRTLLELLSLNPSSSSYNNNGRKALSGRQPCSSLNMVPANMIGSLIFSSQQGNKGRSTTDDDNRNMHHHHHNNNFIGLPFYNSNINDLINFNYNGKLGSSSSDLVVSPSRSPPTVRLMGKDVPIDETSSEKNDDALTVEEFRRRHCSKVAIATAANATNNNNNSPLGRCSNHNNNSQLLVSSSTFKIPSPNSSVAVLPSWMSGSSTSTNERLPAGTSVNLHHHSPERLFEYPSSDNSSPRKRPAIVDLVVDLTRPNKSPNTGQSSGNNAESRRDEELIEHARFFMMNNARIRTQQNDVVISSSSGVVQASSADLEHILESSSRTMDQEEDEEDNTRM